MGKKISIVFEETGEKNAEGNQPFNVYLEGHDSARMKLPDEQLTAAEFWAKKSLHIIMDVMGRVGMVHEVKTREKKS